MLCLLAALLGISICGFFASVSNYPFSSQLEWDIHYGLRGTGTTNGEGFEEDRVKIHRAAKNVGAKFLWPMLGSGSGIMAALIGLVLLRRFR